MECVSVLSALRGKTIGLFSQAGRQADTDDMQMDR